VTILCYHSVQPDWESPLAADPVDFARQCAWLARNRRVLPLSDAVSRLDRSGRLPKGSAVMTFDDGFATLFEYAMPALRRHRLPATVFLVAQTLTPQGQPVDWVDSPPPHPPAGLSTLTRDQVLEMRSLGVDFQSHSYAHHDLTTLGFDSCVRDLRESREFLSDLLGRPVSMLAYPRGRHDEVVRRAAERAGYGHAFALPERAEQPGRYSIPRVGVYRGNSMATVRIKSARSYLAVRTDPRWPKVASLLRRATRR
jgi:peptidoglycan/xylan/chitin deacetylase (PgdA/CDA1 family)